MEVYTKLKNYDFKGYIEGQRKWGEECTFLDAIEHWWGEIEHLTTARDVVFPLKLMLSTPTDGGLQARNLSAVETDGGARLPTNLHQPKWVPNGRG